MLLKLCFMLSMPTAAEGRCADCCLSGSPLGWEQLKHKEPGKPVSRGLDWRTKAHQCREQGWMPKQHLESRRGDWVRRRLIITITAKSLATQGTGREVSCSPTCWVWKTMSCELRMKLQGNCNVLNWGRAIPEVFHFHLNLFIRYTLGLGGGICSEGLDGLKSRSWWNQFSPSDWILYATATCGSQRK